MSKAAAEWLLQRLAAGPAWAGDILAEARAAGFSPRTMQLAGAALKVRRRKDGMAGAWRWELPESKPAPSRPAACAFGPRPLAPSPPAPAEDPERDGLRCPACACQHFFVLKTLCKDGRIWRRRECRFCGRRVSTTEKIQGQP